MDYVLGSKLPPLSKTKHQCPNCLKNRDIGELGTFLLSSLQPIQIEWEYEGELIRLGPGYVDLCEGCGYPLIVSDDKPARKIPLALLQDLPFSHKLYLESMYAAAKKLFNREAEVASN